MTWQQIVVASYLVLAVLLDVAVAVKDPDLTSAGATFSIFIGFVRSLTLALVLSSGGFW